MDAEGRNSLLTAVKKGDVETAASLLARYVNINQSCLSSTNMLEFFIACSSNNVSMVHLLVKYGANVEFSGRIDKTVLMCVVSYDVLKFLLSAGARVNRRGTFGMTALHFCRETKSIKLLLQEDAIIRKNEFGRLPIISNAGFGRTQAVEFLHKHIDSGDRPRFTRQSNHTRNQYSSTIDTTDKVDDYKMLGASYFPSNTMDAIHAWTTAVSLSEKVDIEPKRQVNLSPSCTCCMQLSAEKADICAELKKPTTAWSAVSLPAREIVAGMELLQHAIKRVEPRWMSKFLPCFHCPTCPPGHCVRSLVHQSLSKVRRCHVFDMVYMDKWKHLQTKLQLLYKHKEVSQPFHSKVCRTTLKQPLPRSKAVRTHYMGSNAYGQGNMNANHCSTSINNGQFIKPTSMTDAILGIEPNCFVKTRCNQNDLDPRSYYLQRNWLVSRYYTPPRTTHRCSYNVCSVCGYMVIKFGENNHPQSPGFTVPMSNSTTDLFCEGCSLVCQEFGTEDSKRVVARRSDYSYRNSAGHKPTLVDSEAIAIGNGQTTAMKVCQHCGLVSEQHPLVQRLRKCCEEVYGDAREFASREEVTELMSNPATFMLQRKLIDLRLFRVADPVDVLNSITDHEREDFPFARILDYTFACLKILSHLNYLNCHLFVRRWHYFISHGLHANNVHSIGPNFIVAYLELLVDCIERKFEKTFYRLDEKPAENLEDKSICCLIVVYLHLATGVLLYYLPEVPFFRSSLQGRYLIDLVTRKYCQGKINEDSLFPHSQLSIASDSKDDTSFNQETLSAALIHRFVTQVYRLVCLEPKLEICSTLIKQLYSLESSTRVNKSGEAHCEVPTLQLLLQLGVDPNDVASDGQTAVGYLLENRSIIQKTVDCQLSALMKAGVHLDAYKRSDDDADLAERLCDFLQRNNVCPVRNGKLTCLAATVLRRNRVTTRWKLADFLIVIHNYLVKFNRERSSVVFSKQ